MTLKEKMIKYLPKSAVVTEGGRELFMEVMDPSDRQTWMARASVQKEDFKSLSPEPPFVKTGAALSSMDMAAFVHSPDSDNVLFKTIDGREFINVARPETFQPPESEAGPVKVTVNKNHVLGFKTGREINYFSTNEGHFVEVIGDNKNDHKLSLPDGAVIKTLFISEPLIVHLPTPTTTYFWGMPGTKFAGQLRSFQGPVVLPIS